MEPARTEKVAEALLIFNPRQLEKFFGPDPEARKIWAEKIRVLLGGESFEFVQKTIIVFRNTSRTKLEEYFPRIRNLYYEEDPV